MKSKLAQHLLLACVSTFALCGTSYASNDEINIKMKGVSPTSATAQAFRENPAQTFAVIEAMLRERADEAANPHLTTIKMRVPTSSLTADAFEEDPEGAVGNIEALFEEKDQEAANPGLTTIKARVSSYSHTVDSFQSDPDGLFNLLESYLVEKAKDESDKAFSLLTLKIKIQEGTPIERAFQVGQMAAIGDINAVLTPVQEKADLLKNAQTGEFFALRRLPNYTDDPREKLKWGFVEFLWSFGESFPYLEMLKQAQDLSSTAVDRALVDAATWLCENCYYSQEIEWKSGDFQQLFDGFLAQGKTRSFFANLTKNKKLNVAYLRFFDSMGVCRPNLKSAMDALKRPIRGKHAPTLELNALLKYLRNVGDESAKTQLLEVTEASKRPIMKHVHEITSGNMSFLQSHRNQGESIASLRETLHLGE